MKVLPLLSITLALAACAVAPSKLSGLTSPAEAVQAANGNPNGGARGTFALTVNEIGVTSKRIFLDSAANYHDHDNLAITMSHQVARQVANCLGMSIANLKYRRIVVHGVAKRVRIYFVRGGKYTGRYYYQTWVRVTSPTQISFAKRMPTVRCS